MAALSKGLSKEGKLRCDMKSFIEKCLEGSVLFSEIHDYIEQWHESADIDVPLNEYLGMTQEEYDLFVKDEKNLGYIFYSRRHKVSLDFVLKGDHRIAARTTSLDKAEEIDLWLKSEGLC